MPNSSDNKFFTFSKVLAECISAPGMADVIIQRITRPLVYCYPGSADPCNKRIIRSVNWSSLIIAWLDYLIKWIPENRNDSCVAKISSKWKFTIDIATMWDFYLYFSLAMYVEKNGEDQDMPDPLFVVTAMGTCLAAILSNIEVRRKLWNRYCPEGERGNLIKLTDAFFELWRGFARGRGFVATIERFFSLILSNSQLTASQGSMIARYLMGGMWGIISSTLAFQYSPTIGLTDLLSAPRSSVGDRYISFQDTQELSSHGSKKIIELFNSIFTAVTVGTIIAFNLKDEESPYKELFSVGFSLLALGAIVFAYIKNSNCSRAVIAENRSSGSRFSFWKSTITSSAISAPELTQNDTKKAVINLELPHNT